MAQNESERSLRSRVSQSIRRMILNGEFRPGDRLLQQQLARKFGVSQSVMRESLLEAQFTGLVESVNGMGASVAAIDLPQLLDAYEVREMLEGLASRLCCNKASPAHVKELTEIAHRVHDLGVAGKNDDRAQLDRHFHERIIEISDNKAVQRLSGGYHVVRLAALRSVDDEHVLADHLAIVEAIAANKPEEAERAARKHVVAARDTIRRLIETNEFKFPWNPPA